MDLCRLIVSALCLCTLFFGSAWCYSSATFSNPMAEKFACQERNPVGHQTTSQSVPSPYQLTTSTESYAEGSYVVLTLSSQSSTFKGFLVQAVVEGTDTRVGEFTAGTLSKTNCPNEGGKTITHTDSSAKSSINFGWTAPDSDVGNVVFMYTVVQSLKTIWVNESSTELTYNASYVSVTAPPTTPSTNAPTVTSSGNGPQIDVTTCGVSKSCFRLPEGCQSDCEWVVTWARTISGNLRFEAGASTTETGAQYLALGFSKDNTMGSDSVLYCSYSTSDPAAADVRAAYNVDSGKNNEPLTAKYLSLIPADSEVLFGDGRVVCRFTRKIAVDPSFDPEADKVYDLNAQEYNLLVAKGMLSGDSLEYHFENKIVSSDQFNFTSAPVDGGGAATGNQLLIKIHGILMIVAWMVSASFAVLMPRYGKPAWPDTKWCGKQVWFQIHMPLMLCTLFLTVAGFIVIFVSVQGFAEYPDLPSKAHPILGIIVTALAIINPLMAACRPHPGTPKRPIFNWFHFFVGTSAHICSIATIFIAMYMTKAGAPEYGQWVMVAFVCFHTFIEFCLAIHMHCCLKAKRMTNYEMKESGVSSGTEERKPHGTKGKTFFMVLHLLGVLGLALSLIIPIALA